MTTTPARVRFGRPNRSPAEVSLGITFRRLARSGLERAVSTNAASGPLHDFLELPPRSLPGIRVPSRRLDQFVSHMAPSIRLRYRACSFRIAPAHTTPVHRAPQSRSFPAAVSTPWAGTGSTSIATYPIPTFPHKGGCFVSRLSSLFSLLSSLASRAYLIASGLTGEPTAPVIGSAGATNRNS